MISPSPDSRRRVSIDTTPLISKKRPAVVDLSENPSDTDLEAESPEPAKKKKTKAANKKQKTTKHSQVSPTAYSYHWLQLIDLTYIYHIWQPQDTETKSTFVTKEILRADSDDENNKVQPRATKADNQALLDYFGEPTRKKNDVSRSSGPS